MSFDHYLRLSYKKGIAKVHFDARVTRKRTEGFSASSRDGHVGGLDSRKPVSFSNTVEVQLYGILLCRSRYGHKALSRLIIQFRER